MSRLNPATFGAQMQAVITQLAPEGWTLQSAHVPKGDKYGHTPTADTTEASLLVILHVWSGSVSKRLGVCCVIFSSCSEHGDEWKGQSKVKPTVHGLP